MMQTPLTVGAMLEHAEKFFAKKEVISQTHDKLHRLTYADIGERTRRLMSVLSQLGVGKGDRVGTLAWNHHRHLEVYFAAPGMNAVLHTINIRLSAEHITYIINHAEDQVLFIDEDILPLIEAIQNQLKTVKAFVVMTDKEELPESKLKPLYSYESLLETGDPQHPFITDMDENDPAGMCYTSATTGKPKGVVYSHRGITLHAFALGLANTAAISESDVAMPVVPQFHVNAWGIPFASTWFGATLVMPGPRFTAKRLANFIEKFRVTMTAGVPTIWIGLQRELEQNDYDTSSLRGVLCGGAAAPRGLIEAFEKKLGVPFAHAYGATETTPLVTYSRLKSYQQNLNDEEKIEERTKQGALVPGLDMKVIGQNDKEVAWDDNEMGELLLRGPWIASEYYKDDRTAEAFEDGWFYTGDVVTIDEEGNIRIVDRTKDLIKSGGEWISSVEIENAIMAHENVLEASVVGMPDAEWQERPVACVVMNEYSVSIGKEEILDFIRPQFAKWWLPDDVLFFEEIPKTSVGKFMKRELREQVQNHYQV